MARVRLLKPGFFLNDQLAELPFEARLLFLGLWGIADREGRLLDRPKRIKAEVFPYDEIDVEPLLASLNEAGFIRRYSANEASIIEQPLANEASMIREARSRSKQLPVNSKQLPVTSSSERCCCR